MGLVSRRNVQLDKLFDQFAIDPKKVKGKPKSDKGKNSATDAENKNKGNK